MPESERPRVKIDFSVNDRAGFAQTLDACPDRRTGFPGGLRVRGPRCSELVIRVEGDAQPIVKPVSFGAGRCRSG